MFVARRITDADISAVRRRADKYFSVDASPSHQSKPAATLNDDVRTLARYLFADSIGSSRGGVERSQAIAALADLAKVSYERLKDEFNRAPAATAPAPVYKIFIRRGKTEIARFTGYDKHEVQTQAIASARRHAQKRAIKLATSGFTNAEISGIIEIVKKDARHGVSATEK